MAQKITKKLMFFIEKQIKNCLKNKRVKDAAYDNVKVTARWNFTDRTVKIVIYGLDDELDMTKEKKHDKNGKNNL